MVSNCPKCQMVLGVKLSAVSNGPRILVCLGGYQFCVGGRGGSVYGYGSGTDWKLVNGVHSI